MSALKDRVEGDFLCVGAVIEFVDRRRQLFFEVELEFRIRSRRSRGVCKQRPQRFGIDAAVDGQAFLKLKIAKRAARAKTHHTVRRQLQPEFAVQSLLYPAGVSATAVSLISAFHSKRTDFKIKLVPHIISPFFSRINP